MTWYKITYSSGRVEYLNDDDPVNKNQINVLRRNMQTSGPVNAAMGQAGNTPTKIEGSSESAARKAAGK